MVDQEDEYFELDKKRDKLKIPLKFKTKISEYDGKKYTPSLDEAEKTDIKEDSDIEVNIIDKKKKSKKKDDKKPSLGW